MENRIQPILCCVGAEVAGEPTQFLMERAASAAHLDWHVITVEVAAEQLAKAWDGMHVMRFQAVRFFPALQSAAMNLVAVPSESDRFIGGITSALRSGETWSMWHNSGPALIELLSTKVPWSSAVCWIHGNTMRHRSFLAACHVCRPQKIIWTGSELSTPDPNSMPSPLPEFLAELPITIVPPESGEEVVTLLTVGDENVPSALVHIGEPSAKRLEMILHSQPEYDCKLAIVSGVPGSRRKLSETWRVGEVTVLTPADLVIAEEAYDQARWTGQAANLELLREAYDEYSDF